MATRSAASSPPVDERCLPPPLCLALEIGLVLAPQHPIRLDHRAPSASHWVPLIERRTEVASGSSGTSLGFDAPTLEEPAISIFAASVVRFDT
jgi:hypothetical protein